MAKLRHIAITVPDPQKSAEFYMKVFGLKKVSETDWENARGVYLSDGVINLALLHYKTEAAAGKRIAAPNHNVMEAPQPPQKQARVMIDAGNLRLVAFVDELFRVAGKSFLELGRKRVGFLKERYDFDALIAADSLLKLAGLEILEFAPRGRAAVPGAYMIRGALVRQPDGTVQQIGFFLNEPGMQDLPAANRLVTRIVGSLRPGPRRLPAAEPVNGYTTYLQPGPDFSVKWVEHLVELNARGGRVGIYSRGHPHRPEAPPGARPGPG